MVGLLQVRGSLTSFLSWLHFLRPFLMFPGSASRFVTHEALVFFHMMPSFIWGEGDPVNIHCIRIQVWLLFPEGFLFQQRTSREDVVIPLSDFLKAYDVPVEFSSCIKPLLPSPSSPFLA